MERRSIRVKPAPAPAVRRVVVDESSEGQRLDNFLVRLLKGVPKTHVYRVIRSGEVRVNAGRAAADTRLKCGDEVRIPPVRVSARAGAGSDAVSADGGGARSALTAKSAAAAPAREFPVLFEDDHLIALDKPSGVAVHGGSGVASGVIEQLRRARPQARFLELVHRLDRETSGVLLVAKRRSALTHLQDQFRARGADKSVGKTYLALVSGDWPESRKVIDVPLHKFLTAGGERRVRATGADDAQGRRAITLVKVARRLPGFTLLEVTIKTGRTHQIRVHLAGEGCPIAGDDKYGDFALNRRLAKGEGFAFRLERMFLHAWRLRVQHPASGAALAFESPLPPDCQQVLDALGDNAA